jgi:hypothetical protein
MNELLSVSIIAGVVLVVGVGVGCLLWYLKPGKGE